MAALTRDEGGGDEEKAVVAAPMKSWLLRKASWEAKNPARLMLWTQ